MRVILILLVGLSFGCSQLKKSPKITLDQKLDYLLGNVRAHLVESNGFLERGLGAIEKRTDIPSEDKIGLKKAALVTMKGEKVFELVKSYYLNQMSRHDIEMAYRRLTDRRFVEIKQKELDDLSPKTYAQFERYVHAENEYVQKEKIIDEIRDLSQVVDTGVFVATSIRDGLIDLYKTVTFNEAGPNMLRIQTQNQLEQFEMQTRYMIGEALRYSHHKMSLDELNYLLKGHQSKELKAIYSQIPEALGFAYGQAVKAAAYVRGKFNQYASDEAPKNKL